MSELRKLLEGPATDAEIEAYVRGLAAWQCAQCGAPLATRQAPGEGDRFCWDCARPKPRALGRADALEAAGVPRRLARTPWHKRGLPRAQHDPEFQLDHWTGEPWCVLICGPSGAGKSMAAAELLWRLLPTCPGAQWRAAREVSEALRTFADSETHREMAEACRSALLVVDDYGKGMNRQGDRDDVDGMLHMRHGEMLATIVTSNLSPAEILALDGGIGRRLVSDGAVISLSKRWDVAKA